MANKLLELTIRMFNVVSRIFNKIYIYIYIIQLVTRNYYIYIYSNLKNKYTA